jgi:hypothetical protein
VDEKENANPGWRSAFTDRELKEIEFAYVYASEFAHGTDGHNAKVIIAKMQAILEANAIENIPPFELAK